MRLLSPKDCVAWCQEQCIPIVAGSPAPKSAFGCHFPIPEDAGKRVALARLLCESLPDTPGDRLLWVTQSGIWPSGEHRPLADAARTAWGAAEPLSQTPGHLLSLAERNEALSIAVLAILFLWDLWILPSTSDPLFFLSHDEVGAAHFRGVSSHDAFLQHLGALGLAPDPRGAA